MFTVEESKAEPIQGVSTRHYDNEAIVSGAFAFFAVGLLISALGVWVGIQFAPQFALNRGLMYGAMIIELILIFTTHAWSNKYPLGYGMFALFTFLSGITLVPILLVAGAVGGMAIVMRALIASAATFGACALYARTTTRNLLGLGGVLFIALIGLIIMSVIGIFIPWNNTTEMFVSGALILVFAGFTMYDIQTITRIPGINPLVAGIRLYLDFINLFVAFLRLFIAFNNRE